MDSTLIFVPSPDRSKVLSILAPNSFWKTYKFSFLSPVSDVWLLSLDCLHCRYLPWRAGTGRSRCYKGQKLFRLSGCWSGCHNIRRRICRYSGGSGACRWESGHCSGMAGASGLAGKIPIGPRHPHRIVNFLFGYKGLTMGSLSFKQVLLY